MPVKTIELQPIRIPASEWDPIEKEIKEAFLKLIYAPIIKELRVSVRRLDNAKSYSLFDALRSGRITFSRGTFSGRFNSEISKTLRSLGARWDRRTSTYKILQSDLPLELRTAISSSESKFKERINFIDRKLASVSPEDVAGKIKLSDKFDRTIFKVDKAFQKNVEGIAIAPALSDAARAKIADEWQNNLQLFIKSFLGEQIIELRKDIATSVFAGDRYGAAVKSIQKSYGVSANKAKFLARQETKLLVTGLQEARYADVGINEYNWYHVVGSPAHPVRPQHKKLGDAMENGKKKIYKFDDPPITSEPGQPVRKNNPGRDYNCRCFSRAVVRFHT